MASEHESKALVSVVSRIFVIILFAIIGLLVALHLPPSFDSDEVKIERIRSDRLEMFMRKLHTMDDTTVRAVLENIENIEKAMSVKVEVSD